MIPLMKKKILDLADVVIIRSSNKDNNEPLVAEIIEAAPTAATVPTIAVEVPQVVAATWPLAAAHIVETFLATHMQQQQYLQQQHY